MKFILIGICLLALSQKAFVGADGINYDELYEQCSEDLGYGRADFKHLLNKSDGSLGCVTLCVMKITGEWQNNKIDKEHVLKLAKEEFNDSLDDETVQGIIKCVDKGNNSNLDNCGKGLEFAMCFSELLGEDEEEQ